MGRVERSEEVFAKQALSVYFGKGMPLLTFAVPARDPPDYWMNYGGQQIALEVTQATDQQYVPTPGDGNSFESSSAISADEPVLRLVDELNEKLGPKIPNDRRIFLSLEGPFEDFPRFRRWIEKQVVKFATAKTKLHGAKLKLHWPPTTATRRYIRPNVEISGRARRPTETIIGGGVSNRYSRSEIPLGVKAVHLLAKILFEKERKTLNITHDKWLCIVNRAILLDRSNFREAFAKVSINHRFSRILIVGQDGAVADLHNET